MLPFPGFAKRTACLVAMCLATGAYTQRAHAADPFRIALFKTASDDAGLSSLSGTIDPVLFSELTKVPDLEVGARPALDLPSMQLAIDCVGDTPSCLTQAAKETQADGLIAPQLRRVGAELVVSVVLHDARKNTPIKLAQRRYTGANIEDKVLDGLPAMVRELFGIAEPAAAVPPPAAVPVATPEPAPPEPVVQAPPPSEPLPAEPPPAEAKSDIPVLPIVLGGVGVALIAAGVAFGVAANSGEDDYANVRVIDDGLKTAKQANEKYDSASTMAVLANVGFGLGAAAIVAGAVLFVVDLGEPMPQKDRAQARLKLGVRPGGAVLSGSWN